MAYGTNSNGGYSGTIIASSIRPADPLQTIATVFSNEIKGALHSYETIAERDSLIIERRDWGMLVVIYNDSTPANNKTYQLTYGYSSTTLTDNLNWKEFSGSGGGGGGEWLESVLSVSFTEPVSPSNGDRYLVGRKQSDTVTGTNWISLTPGFIAQWSSAISNWEYTYPTNGTSVRVDDEDNSIYRYEGIYTSGGTWEKEKESQIRNIIATQTNGASYSAISIPSIDQYDTDSLYIVKFTNTNVGASVSLNINGLGDVTVKKTDGSILTDIYSTQIKTGYQYLVTYNGTFFELLNPSPSGATSSFGGVGIKYNITPEDNIIVPPNTQYWVYGDLNIDGSLDNMGHVVVTNGSVTLGPTGSFNVGTWSNVNFAEIDGLGEVNYVPRWASSYMLTATSSIMDDGDSVTITGSTFSINSDIVIPSGASAGYVLTSDNSGIATWQPGGVSVSFDDSSTIGFTQSGVTYSAYVIDGSLTASSLNNGSNGGATAGYLLSNTEDGNFAWVAPSAPAANLSVSDYSNGTTFSNIENIIFRGGLVTTPNYGGTAMGVLAGAPTSSNSVTVWIPAPPAAVYASHFNTTDGNTTGTVTRSLSTSTVRISSPTTEGTPFETGGWAGTNQAATITSTPTFQTGGLVTGFSGTSSGDARVIVDVFRADGVATFSTYTTPTLYQNGVHTNSAGITVTIGSYATDDSGFPSIYVTKYKATVSVSVNMSTIFAAYGLDGGRYSVRVRFITDTATDGGSTYTATTSSVFYDTNPNTPSIGGATTIIESASSSNILTKHISGVEYYIAGSQFELTTTSINNLNKNTQGSPVGTSKNFTITGVNYNLPQRDLQAWSPSVGTFVGWLNNYDNTGITFSYTSWAISSTPTTFRYRGSGALAVSQPFDPWGTGLGIPSPTSSVLIDLVSNNSTRLGESFNGETERLSAGSSTFSTWDSTTTLGTSISNQTGTGPFCDACLVGGYLVRPDKYWLSAGLTTLQPNLTSYKPDKNGTNPDYSGSGYQTKATYHRRWYTSSALNITSFSMAFSGTVTGYTDFTAALSASQLKVYIRRISSPTGNYGPTCPPLSLHGGVYDFGSFDDGNSGIDTSGSLIRTTSSGNVVSGTFGGNVANVGFWMELQIVDPSIKIDYINVTLTFDNSTTDSAPVT